jgi:hypothetical protein
VTSPSLLILGTDAVLAASPATPVQLAHACLAAGYRSVVPVSWGDEILARCIVDAIENTNEPLVLCCCPLVARRFGREADIGPMLLSCAAPPVATAAYLRALYAPANVRVTFVGACPSGGHGSIDAWLTPAELFADLASKGIHPSSQPTEFDSVLPPDRRRHFSEPGGVPARDVLRRANGAPELIELDAVDFAIDLAQTLLAGGQRVVDVAPALGCLCSGVVPGVSAQSARSRVRSTEPPRSPFPVVDHDVALGLDIVAIGEKHERVLLPAAREHALAVMPVRTPAVESVPASIPGNAAGDSSVLAAPPQDGARRRSSASGNRAVIGAMPQSRSAGRQLPRAYVARRRSSPKGIRQSGVRRQVDVLGPYREREAVPRWIWIAGIGTVIVAVAGVLILL